MCIKDFVKRITVLALSISMIIGLVTSVSYAESYDIRAIQIVHDGESGSFEVLVKDNDLYLSAEDYSVITRYKVSETDEEIRLSLGSKAVCFEIGKTAYYVTQGDKTYTYNNSGTIQNEGKNYISLSEALPWLNTNAYVKDGQLMINSDPYTFWELRGVTRNLFDLTGIDTGSKWTAAELVALNVFDNFINIRWQRFVPMFITDSRYDRTHTLYDLDNYKDCLMSLATDDTLFSEKVDGVLKKTKSVGKIAKSTEEVLGVDDEKKDEISRFLISLRDDSYYKDITTGNDVDIYDLWVGFDDLWQKAIVAGEVADGMTDVWSIVKCVETAQNAMPDYMRAVSYISTNIDDDNHILKETSEDANKAMKDAVPVALRKSLEIGSEKLKDIATNKIEDAVGGSFAATLSAVKTALKILWPSFMEAAEGIGKLGPYQDIMLTSMDLSTALASNGMEYDDINNSRSLMILACKASKEQFKILNNLKKAFGKKGFYDERIKQIDETIVKLALCESSVENDSIMNKETSSDELQKQLGNVELTEILTGDALYGTAFDCIGKSFSELENSYGKLSRLDYSEGSLYFTTSDNMELGFQYVGDGNPPVGSLCSSFIGSLDTVFNVPSNTSLNHLAEMLDQDFDESSLEYYSDVPYLNVVIWNISYDGREYKVMVGYDENHNIGDVTLFCESFTQPADTGHSMFDETIWTCVRGQSQAGQSLIKFHADETFSEYLYGSDEMISDAGTWFYDSINDTLYINDSASYASSGEEVYTKDGDSFRSIDPVEMMAGEDYMWIRPGTDDQGVFN